MKLILIRHGQTKGNAQHRYVGRTDEPILPEEEKRLPERREELQACGIGKTNRLFTSPMKRCKQTASLLFPYMHQEEVADLREMDFGDFEYCSFADLNGNAAYQKFIDSDGEAPFPGGESKNAFAVRCKKAFLQLVPELLEEERMAKREWTVAFVVHGGTIMALLDAFSAPHKDYFAWQTGNGEGYCCKLTGGIETPVRFEEIKKI